MIRVNVFKFLEWMGECTTGTRRADGNCGVTPWTAYMIVTYVEYAITLFFLSSTVATTFGPAAVGNLSVQLHGVLCILIEAFMLLNIPLRSHRRARAGFRDMVRFTDGMDVRSDYQFAIRTIARYHLIASVTYVSVPALYVIACDSVSPGDPFTFPFLDVLPVDTPNITAYVCKYAVYALPVYIAHAETFFLKLTFIYSLGVIEQHCEIIAQQVRDAVVDADQRKIKIAIVHHQVLLKYFENIKNLHGKSIVLVIAFCGMYFGITTCVIIQAIQGYVNKMILAVCLASGIAALINIYIYCFYASSINDLHDRILLEFSHERLFSADKSFKQISLIMMTRLSIPLQYEIGYVFKINLNLLVKIIKFSYTWLNVLLASVGGRYLT